MTPAVDWDLAIATGTRLVPAGPRVSPEEAADSVAALRIAADAAQDHIRDVTRLDVPRNLSPTLVVDRPSWIRANVDTMRTLMGDRPTGVVAAKAGGVETGVVLAFLAPRILGQFDPFHGDHGRLLLLAPNVLKVHQDLHLSADDFRLWVCLHEETHRVQFTYAPWLADLLKARITALLESMGGVSELELLVRGARAQRAEPTGGSLLDAVVTAEQREILDDVTAVMSLLEGHADVMMDRVGTRVVPTLHRIRRTFDHRRTATRGRLDRIIRRIFGLDAKLRQYQDGAAFCKRVIARTGVDGLNVAFTESEALPTLTEIRDPNLWLNRVAGRAA